MRHFAPSRQQQQNNALRQQRQHQVNTAFGMTYDELEEALKVDFIPSPYTNMHADLMLHLQHLNFSLTDDPETAHRKALAFTRILNAVLTLEDKIRIQKPELSLIKYAYPDETYHDVPFWSNAIHDRAWAAYQAVVAEAQRQYEEQQAAQKEKVASEMKEAETFFADEANQAEEEDYPDWANMSAEEIIAMPFKPEDFIPKHTGILKYFLGETPSPRPKHLGDLPKPPNPDEKL